MLDLAASFMQGKVGYLSASPLLVGAIHIFGAGEQTSCG